MPELIRYMRHAKGLFFNESPDYSCFYQRFKSLSLSMQQPYDYIFDWTILKQNRPSNLPNLVADNEAISQLINHVWF